MTLVMSKIASRTQMPRNQIAADFLFIILHFLTRSHLTNVLHLPFSQRDGFARRSRLRRDCSG
jgi:hypothetical protein